MTGSIIIAEWPLNSRDRLRVLIKEYNGADLVSVRKWFTADDGTLRPSKQGVAIKPKHLPQLSDAIAKALTTAIAHGLIDNLPGDGGAP